MVELTLVGVRVEVPSNNPIVLLREGETNRFLPIWIGAPEATAIASAMQKIEQPRPMTHDLLRDILDAFDGEVHRVVITELREQTFFAVIDVTLGGVRKEISSRPSDAIALAVRVDCPIFGSEEVLDDAGIFVEEAMVEAAGIGGEGGVAAGADDQIERIQSEESQVAAFRAFIHSVSADEFRATIDPDG